MREKLLDLMKSEGLKPGQLAEMLEVNPAGISHILAGRNKPGFEMLQKILRRFPRINPDWLLLDSDKMYRDGAAEGAAARAAGPAAQKDTLPANDLFTSNSDGRADVSSAPATQTNPAGAIPPEISGNSRVRRIIVLYDDQTFESYTPTLR